MNPDPALRRAQLFFLSTGLDFVTPQVELRRLRQDVTQAIFATGEVGRT